jgi:3-methyladenine DNA glycosylase AlkC
MSPKRSTSGARKTPGGIRVPATILAELNRGTRETANLAECLAVDFAWLWEVVVPNGDGSVFRSGKLSITERMKRAGEMLVEEGAIGEIDRWLIHESDTVRGWAAYAIGQAPGATLEERLGQMRPLADDPHFGVREWAWLALRPQIVAEIDAAIERLMPWVHEESPYLRRFATEATRPRGVWAEHIEILKQEPKRGLPLLKPLKADPEKYVQDSVSNWLNDAAKTRPDWVRDLVESWADDCDDRNTLRICKRAMRSVKFDD